MKTGFAVHAAPAGPLKLLMLACTLVAGCLMVTAVLAAPAAQSALQRELAVCSSGASNQARAVCEREVRAANAQGRHGGLDDHQADYQRNARLRCEALKGDDKSACESRMQGGGKVSGSVAEGGVYRELSTRSTAPVASAPRP